MRTSSFPSSRLLTTLLPELPSNCLSLRENLVIPGFMVSLQIPWRYLLFNTTKKLSRLLVSVLMSVLVSLVRRLVSVLLMIRNTTISLPCWPRMVSTLGVSLLLNTCMILITGWMYDDCTCGYAFSLISTSAWMSTRTTLNILWSPGLSNVLMALTYLAMPWVRTTLCASIWTRRMRVWLYVVDRVKWGE